MKTIEVKDASGLNYTLAEIFRLRPVIFFQDEAYSVLPPKAETGIVVTFFDAVNTVELRLQKIQRMSTKT